MINKTTNKKILIIGGSGFIGSSLIEKLINLSYELTIFIRNKNSINIKNKKIKYIRGDLLSPNFWKRNINNKDFLINLISNENKFGIKIDLLNNFEINVKVMLMALHSSYKFNRHIKIISFGTENQHGISKKLPINEKDQDSPVTFFGLNKQIIENYMKYFCENLNIKSVNLRLPNVYGPSTSKENFLKISLNKMIIGSLTGKVNLYNNQNCIRDYIFIDDVVNAILISIKKFNILDNHFYYIGSGTGNKIIDIVNKIENILVIKKRIKKVVKLNHNIKLSKFDHRNFIANSNCFKKLTNWKPETNIDNGLLKTIDYIIRKKWK